jgi:hypothetical protein
MGADQVFNLKNLIETYRFNDGGQPIGMLICGD